MNKQLVALIVGLSLFQITTKNPREDEQDTNWFGLTEIPLKHWETRKSTKAIGSEIK